MSTDGATPALAGEAAFACGTCGSSPEQEEQALARLTWTRGTENGRVVWTCPTCTRAHARSIEGKLDPAWW